MIIKYDDKEYNFDLEEIDVAQATTIYSKCGMTLLGLEKGMMEGHPMALKAIFWLMLIQNGEKADIDRVNFKIVKFARAIDEAATRENAPAEEAEKAPKGAARSRA